MSNARWASRHSVRQIVWRTHGYIDAGGKCPHRSTGSPHQGRWPPSRRPTEQPEGDKADQEEPLRQIKPVSFRWKCDKQFNGLALLLGIFTLVGLAHRATAKLVVLRDTNDEGGQGDHSQCEHMIFKPWKLWARDTEDHRIHGHKQHRPEVEEE